MTTSQTMPSLAAQTRTLGGKSAVRRVRAEGQVPAVAYGKGLTSMPLAVAPKEIEYASALPRTRSGKIMRRLLKARELGLPEGDTSTLETAQ